MRLDGAQVADELRRLRAVGAVADAHAAFDIGGRDDEVGKRRQHAHAVQDARKRL